MTPKTTTYRIQGKAGFQSNISGGACFACVVVRRFLLFLLLSALLTPLTTLFSACGHDDLVPPDVYVEEKVPYVELRIAVPAANSLTRGNPLGGEEGNGREQGVMNEDKIHDINIFFYKEDNGLGMNSSDGTKLLGHFFYNLDNENDTENSELLPDTELVEKDKAKPENQDSYYGIQYVSLKFKCSEDLAEKAKDINFLAVANMGKIQYRDDMTLGDLKNLELKYYNNSWTNSYDASSANVTKMDYFLMSTAYADNYKYDGRRETGTNKIEKSTSDDKQYIGTTTLQRLYARLDLWYNADNIIGGTGNNEKTVKELKYQIVDKDDSKLSSSVYITNILPVNVMQKPSFLFKKVIKLPSTLSDWNADSNNTVWDLNSSVWTSGTTKWGGKETPSGIPTSSPKDIPTNYVLERHTLSKLDTGKPGTEISYTDSLSAWYGNTAVSKVSADETSADYQYSIMNVEKGKLSAYFDMERLKGADDPDYDCNHISIIGYANENTHPTDCFHRNYLTGMAFRGVYVPADIYTAYDEVADDGKTTTGLTSMTDAEVVNFGIAETTNEENKTKIYRYSPTAGKSQKQLEKESKYFVNKTDAENYAKAHPAEMGIITAYNAIKHDTKDADGNTVKKLGFICYYNVWLRHYNDENDKKTDPHPHLPMEYATVRNNIYRLAVSFTGPGDPTPTMREPDAMKARIFVRKWNYKKESTLDF